MVPDRAAVSLFDATRSVLKTGKWSWTGLSVEDIWLKYEREIKAELEEESWLRDAASSSEFAGTSALDNSPSSSSNGSDYIVRGFSSQAEADRELYRRLYQRIIQRSCATNPMVDRLAMLTPSKVAGEVFSMLAPTSSSSSGGRANARGRPNSAAETEERAAFMEAQRRAADLVALQEARLLGEAQQRMHDSRADTATTIKYDGVPASIGAEGEGLAEKQRADRLLRLLRTMRFKDKVTRIMASANFASLLVFDRAKAQAGGDESSRSDMGGGGNCEVGASEESSREEEKRQGKSPR